MKRLLGLMLLMILTMRPAVFAQELQPTGQASPEVRNPQVQPLQNLGAPITPLQSATEPQVLGTSINQSAAAPLRVLVPNAVAATNATAYDDPLNKPEQLTSEQPKINNNLVVEVMGGLTLLLGLLALYLAIKRRMSQSR